jgi:radical SAM protein with 4Fe4S-binding SPASM domain
MYQNKKDSLKKIISKKNNFKNVGWTLGNSCPFHCDHCYSKPVRQGSLYLTTKMADRIIKELLLLNIQNVNFGGNEPIFTNGFNINLSILPYVLEKLFNNGVKVGLTTCGTSLIFLYRKWPHLLKFLNDIDISLDSPFSNEHNGSRGADLFEDAMHALKICNLLNIERTIIVCAMRWNFTINHLKGFIKISKKFRANLRINSLRPVELKHLNLMPTPIQYFTGFAYLLEKSDSFDLSDPPIATVCNFENSKCPCGLTSFRIHSINTYGEIAVSPCVYLHDYKTGNILKESLSSIVSSPPFIDFQFRSNNPELIKECTDCLFLNICRGGCIARSYLTTFHLKKVKTLYSQDPYCVKNELENGKILLKQFPKINNLKSSKNLIHHNYLCTWIGRPY